MSGYWAVRNRGRRRSLILMMPGTSVMEPLTQRLSGGDAEKRTRARRPSREAATAECLRIAVAPGRARASARGLPTVARWGALSCPPPRRFATLWWATFACDRERRLVRKKGLEPSRPCGRQPLKLVRLPIPPLPHFEARRARYSMRATLSLTSPAAVRVPRGLRAPQGPVSRPSARPAPEPSPRRVTAVRGRLRPSRAHAGRESRAPARRQ